MYWKFQDVSILPAGCTSIFQPLDINIDELFKNLLKEKYIKHCIDKTVVFSKVGKEDIIKLVLHIWYDVKFISKDLIKR